MEWVSHWSGLKTGSNSNDAVDIEKQYTFFQNQVKDQNTAFGAQLV